MAIVVTMTESVRTLDPLGNPTGLRFTLFLRDEKSGNNREQPYTLTDAEFAGGDLSSVIARQLTIACAELAKQMADPDAPTEEVAQDVIDAYTFTADDQGVAVAHVQPVDIKTPIKPPVKGIGVDLTRLGSVDVG